MLLQPPCGARRRADFDGPQQARAAEGAWQRADDRVRPLPQILRADHRRTALAKPRQLRKAQVRPVDQLCADRDRRRWVERRKGLVKTYKKRLDSSVMPLNRGVSMLTVVRKEVFPFQENICFPLFGNI